jgi:hypothetical protein
MSIGWRECCARAQKVPAGPTKAIRISKWIAGISPTLFRQLYTEDMSLSDPQSPALRRSSFGLPRPLWIGVVTIVVFGCAAGLRFGVPIYRQRVALQELVALGATWETGPRGPEWLQKYTSLGDVVIRIDLNDTDVADGDLIRLRELTSLEVVSLDRTQVTDAGVAHLAAMKNLRGLSLNQTKLTDAGLMQLQEMKELQSLDIGRTDITDAGLLYLKGLTHLENLDLGGTEVTDAGLVHLTGLASLRRLVLRSVLHEKRVSRAGIADLKRAMPLLHVTSG